MVKESLKQRIPLCMLLNMSKQPRGAGSSPDAAAGPRLLLSSTHTRGTELTCSSGTHPLECIWHSGLFQLLFSQLTMPGDIFVFIAGAGSLLQVLIIGCSSSTRQSVCELPFSPPPRVSLLALSLPRVTRILSPPQFAFCRTSCLQHPVCQPW